jgi:hypothetical protein
MFVIASRAGFSEVVQDPEALVAGLVVVFRRNAGQLTELAESTVRTSPATEKDWGIRIWLVGAKALQVEPNCAVHFPPGSPRSNRDDLRWSWLSSEGSFHTWLKPLSSARRFGANSRRLMGNSNNQVQSGFSLYHHRIRYIRDLREDWSDSQTRGSNKQVAVGPWWRCSRMNGIRSLFNERALRFAVIPMLGSVSNKRKVLSNAK